LNKALQIKNKVKSAIKKFDDLKIPLNIHEQTKIHKKADNPIKPCTSKSTEILSAEENDDENEETWKKKRKLGQLKIAPVINLDEYEFLGSSSLAIETENGLYHHKDNKNDNV